MDFCFIAQFDFHKPAESNELTAAQGKTFQAFSVTTELFWGLTTRRHWPAPDASLPLTNHK